MNRVAEYVIYLLIRKEPNFKMGAGKAIAQGGHAIHGLMTSDFRRGTGNETLFRKYSRGDSPKIACRATLEEINRAELECYNMKIPTFRVIDAGRTQVEPGSTTVLGVGPVMRETVPEIIKGLKLY